MTIFKFSFQLLLELGIDPDARHFSYPDFYLDPQNIAVNTIKFKQIGLAIEKMSLKDTERRPNSADSGQTAPRGAV